MTKQTQASALTIAALLAAAFATPAQAQTYGKNLVVNGDAESGTGTTGGNTPPAIPGWTSANVPNVVLYSANGHLSLKSQGPTNRGNNYFTGTNTAVGTLTQTIDVSAFGTAIDKGTVSYDASGYLGGNSLDNASLTVTFRGSGGSSLGTFTLGPLTEAERPTDTGIFFRRKIGQMPAGARSVGVEVDLIRSSGINNDGCADNISFALNDDSTLPNTFSGSNLIGNGNAEAPNGTQLPFPLTSVLSSGIIDLPGWARSGAFTLDTYSPDSDLMPTSAGPSDRGSWYFYSGASSASSSATQDIDVAPAATQIDANKVTFNFSAWVGGYADQDDNMIITAQFLNWTGAVLGSTSLGPVYSAERASVSKLIQKAQSGAVPSGTRIIRITMQGTRVSGVDDDGLADSLSMILTVPGAGGLAPTIQAGGVVSASAFGGFSAIGPGTWIEIYGANLASSTRSWAGADFTGAAAPTALDGTSVTIGGQRAYISYISSGQINAQVPSNIGTGVQPVVVNTSNGTSAAFPITVNAVEPGLLAPPSSFLLGGKQYVVALHADNSFVLPPNAIAGLTTRQAQPGENIVLYGIGFGNVTPSISAGQIVAVTNQLALPLQVLFGQASATVLYDGLAPNYVGLYQFNVTVPNVADSDLMPISFNLGGSAGVQTLYIAVKH